MAVIGQKKEEGTPYTPTGFSQSTKSIIGKTVTIKGNISSKEAMEIHGKVEGNIDSEKSVEVKQGGGIKGNIKAQEVRVEGKVEGDITAKNKTVITPQGYVSGKIVTDRLVIEEGAVFRGTVEMGGPIKTETKPQEGKNG